ncbi:MAG: ATP-binding protein, partial [Muribaculaceae bacterium]
QIFYYQGKGECDFVVQVVTKIDKLIQVTWSLDNEETRRREINGLIEAAEVTGCDNLFIVTADYDENIQLENGKEIQVIPAWRWLLNK